MDQIIMNSSVIVYSVTVNVLLQFLALTETVQQLRRQNDSLVQECNKQQRQIRMLEQQASEANRQVW